MTAPNRHGIRPAAVETIAGLSAGLVSTIVVHPLDIIKTRLQGKRLGGFLYLDSC
jgi:solute carrier family 25 (mitochondrial folate transporter), member 32